MNPKKLVLQELIDNFVISVMEIGYTKEEAIDEVKNLIKNKYENKAGN